MWLRIVSACLIAGEASVLLDGLGLDGSANGAGTFKQFLYLTFCFSFFNTFTLFIYFDYSSSYGKLLENLLCFLLAFVLTDLFEN